MRDIASGRSESPRPSIQVRHDAKEAEALRERPERWCDAHPDIAPVEPHGAPATASRHVACELLRTVAEDVVSKLGFDTQRCNKLCSGRRALVIHASVWCATKLSKKLTVHTLQEHLDVKVDCLPANPDYFFNLLL